MRDGPPRVLSTVYRYGLQTLHSLLVELIIEGLSKNGENTQAEEDEPRPTSRPQLRTTQLCSEAEKSEAKKRLVQDGDEESYLRLLKSSYAVMSQTAPTLGPISFEQRWTQEQIVERVLVLQFRQDAKPSHVLCSGYRKLRPAVCNYNQLQAPQGLECVCENSAVENVNSHDWKILLSRVGDVMMLHLLSHAAIFIPLPNDCFLQVSGAPMSAAASAYRKFSSLHPRERMLCRLLKTNSVSNSNRGRTVHHFDVKGGGRTQTCDVGTTATDYLVTDELKQTNNGGVDCDVQDGVGFSGKQNSEMGSFLKSRILETASSSQLHKRSNSGISSGEKRHQQEQAKFQPETDLSRGLMEGLPPSDKWDYPLSISPSKGPKICQKGEKDFNLVKLSRPQRKAGNVSPKSIRMSEEEPNCSMPCEAASVIHETASTLELNKSEQAGGACTRRKRARLSSWQRRKQQKVQESLHDQPRTLESGIHEVHTRDVAESSYGERAGKETGENFETKEDTEHRQKRKAMQEPGAFLESTASEDFTANKGKMARKRQRHASRDQSHMNHGILRPEMDVQFKESLLVSLTNPLVDKPGYKESVCLGRGCKRKSPKEALPPSDNCGQSLVGNPVKKPKLCEEIEKDLNVVRITKRLPKLEQLIHLGLSPSNRKSRRKPDCSMTQETGAVDRAIASTCCGSKSEQGGGARIPGKRLRLPSWQRRKLRKAQESSSAVVCKEGTDEQVWVQQQQTPYKQEKCTRACLDRSHLHVFGLHKVHKSDVAGLTGGETPGKESAVTNYEKEEGKKRPQKTTSKCDPGASSGTPPIIVDRTPLFYSANFCCYPGLPAKHILNITKPNANGAAHLCLTIFGAHSNIPECSFLGNLKTKVLKSGMGCCSKSVHRLLKELLVNARRCAFGRLLERHCPLPQGFRDSSSARFKSKGSDLFKDRHEDHQQELGYADHGPEVEEIMSIWLGSNYLPRRTETTEPVDLTNSVLGNAASPSKKIDELNSETSTGQQGAPSCLPERTKATCTVGENLATQKAPQSELLSCYTKHHNVVGFVFAVFRSIIPQEMLGPVKSWRALRSSIAHFVGLRRHEKFNVQHALFKVSISRFLWLAFPCTQEAGSIPQISSGSFTNKEREFHQKRFEHWLYWLFANLVVPLIRSHFYITENENQRQSIFYYRKPVWARIRSGGLKDLTSKNYKKLTKRAVCQVLNSRGLGFSQIRLLPKNTGLRPIANLAAVSQGTLKFSTQAKQQPTSILGCGDFLKRRESVGSKSNHLQFKVLATQGQDAVMATPTTISPTWSLDMWLSTDFVAASSPSYSAGPCYPPYISRPTKDPQIQNKHVRRLKFSFRSINSVLKDAHCCLKLEKEAHPDDLGSSVFGYSDIHVNVLPFILHLKGSLHGMPRLFMAVCDVAKAYDTIQQDKLQEVLESFVHGSHYNVTRYTGISPTLATVRVSNGRACVSETPCKFLELIQGLATKHSNCVYLDQAVTTNISRQKLLTMVGEHVKQNIVQIGANFYQQTVGIPQGSVLSSLLCSLLYGHFEVHTLQPMLQSRCTKTVNSVVDPNLSSCSITEVERAENDSSLTLSTPKAQVSTQCDDEQILELTLGINNRVQDSKPKSMSSVCMSEDNTHGNQVSSHDGEAAVSSGKDYLLLRLIDDSLFISTSETAAKAFVETMHRGSAEYGFQANKQKTAVSFQCQQGNQALSKKVYKTEDGACFMRWSGLLINCYTLEFQADYTRYCGEHIKSTLTVRREQNQGWHLVLKMCQYMRPKCHALFFDPRINSPATVRLNAFQAFLLCAMKFHAYVCCLQHMAQHNQPFFYKAISSVARYMYDLIRHKIDASVTGAVAHFPYKEMEWLAFVAFHRVLKRKQSRHQVLIHMLQAQLQMPKYDIFKICPHLLSATDERRSSMFKFIKY